MPFVYGYEHRCLEGQFDTLSVKLKTTVVSFPQRLTTSPGMDSGQVFQYWAWSPSCGAVHRSHQREIGYAIAGAPLSHWWVRLAWQVVRTVHRVSAR